MTDPTDQHPTPWRVDNSIPGRIFIRDSKENSVFKYNSAYSSIDTTKKKLNLFCLTAAAVNACAEARKLVDKQAEDDGLWFDAEYASEGYLQQELRKLHAVIEGAGQ